MTLRAVVLAVSALASGVQAQAVNCAGKLSESKVEALLSGGVAQPRVEQIARSCGIDFEVTTAVASRLRRAGAGSGLIGALREVQLKRPEPVVKRDTTRVNPKDGLTYVWIPPGTFSMGCSPGDTECYVPEKPAHQVTITKGFWIGQTEVTQMAYQRVTGSNPSHFKGALLPVDSIGWDKAQAYCQVIGMRLPTEAEWERAARGGNSSARYGTLDAVAWYSGNSSSQTHDVAQKQPNGYGLYDMLGNVWEWTADWYELNYYESNPRSDPQGPSSGQYRALRGGSWSDGSGSGRASVRYWTVPLSRLNYVGVRCAGE